jgi:hypothetical protein
MYALTDDFAASIKEGVRAPYYERKRDAVHAAHKAVAGGADRVLILRSLDGGVWWRGVGHTKRDGEAIVTFFPGSR